MTYEWYKGGQSGGGYANAIAVDPLGGGATVAGDVWGFAATDDLGDFWYPTNLNETPGRPYGRAVAYSIKSPGRRYIGVGTLKFQNGHGGGYLGAIDSSVNQYAIERVNTDVSFTSYLPKGGAGDLPRPVGNLIAVDYDETTGIEYIYMLTRQGLMRSEDGGHTLFDMGLKPPAPLFAWSALAVLPNGKLLLSTFRTSDSGGSELWMVTHPRSDSPIIAQHKSPVAVIEDIASVRLGGKNRFVLAGGAAGVVQLNGTQLLAPVSDVHVSSIVQGADGVLWVGNGIGSKAHHNIARSTDGHNWDWVTDNVSHTIPGTDREWWLDGAWSTLDKGAGYSVSQLAVDPVNPNVVYSAGRAGIWQTRDGGKTWAPAMNGVDGSESNRIILGDNGEAWATDTDYHFSHTTDFFVNAMQTNKGPAPGSSSASLTRGNVKVTTSKPPQILVDGVDVADDFVRSSLANPKDLQVTPEGYIYVSLSGGVLVGKPVCVLVGKPV